MSERDVRKHGVTTAKCISHISRWKDDLLKKPKEVFLGQMRVMRFMTKLESSALRTKLVGVLAQNPKYGHEDKDAKNTE